MRGTAGHLFMGVKQLAPVWWFGGTALIAFVILMAWTGDTPCPAGVRVADCVEYQIEQTPIGATMMVVGAWIVVAFGGWAVVRLGRNRRKWQ
jgi:hypothetical protein